MEQHILENVNSFQIGSKLASAKLGSLAKLTVQKLAHKMVPHFVNMAKGKPGRFYVAEDLLLRTDYM